MEHDTRETVEEDYNYLVFDHFIDRFQSGECTFEQAVSAFQDVMRATGKTALRVDRPD